MPEQPVSHEDLLLADVRYFMRELWLEIGSDNEDGDGIAPLSEIELDMAEYLAHGPRQRIVLGTRGIGKSYIECGVICWKWNRDPNRKILCLSKSKEAVNKTSTLIRGWLNTVSFLKHLKPRKGQRDGIESFEVGGSATGRQPSMFILGIGGQVDNNRGHTIWCDDVETYKNSQTLTERTKLLLTLGNLKFCQFPDIPLERGGPIDGLETVITQTPKHEETVVKALIKQGYSVRSYPLCVPEPGEKNFPLAPAVLQAIDEGRYRASDKCLLGHRFTEEDVQILKATRTLYLRECQLVESIGESDRFPLKLKNLMVFEVADTAPIHLSYGMSDHNGSTAIDVGDPIAFGDDRFYRPAKIDPNWAPFTGTKMRVDQSGAGKDKTGFCVGSVLNGFLFIRRLGGIPGAGATEANFEKLAMMARDTGATTITVETNFGGDAYANGLQLHCNRLKIAPGTDQMRPLGWACHVETKHSHTSKELRIIDAIEPWVGMHRLVVTPSVAADKDFQRQYTRICREKGCLDEDDVIDVLGGLCEDFAEVSRIDPRKLGENRDDEIKKAWIKARDKNRKGPKPNWLDRRPL